jgi:PKD repeat protein
MWHFRNSVKELESVDYYRDSSCYNVAMNRTYVGGLIALGVLATLFIISSSDRTGSFVGRQTAAAGDIITDLVAHYQFEGNVNDSVGGNNADDLSTPAYEEGIVGQAAVLNGSQVLQAPAVAGAQDVAQFTVSAWVKGTGTLTTDGISGYGVVGMQQNGQLHTWSIGYNSHTETFTCFMTSANNTYAQSVGGKIVPRTDTGWHHVICTYDGANVKMYTDMMVGAAGSMTGKLPLPATPDPLCIGGFHGGAGCFTTPTSGSSPWLGSIDDIRLYSRGLVLDDVTKMYCDVQVDDTRCGGSGLNEPPTVSAGTGQIIILPATASLVGTASDDGKPIGNSLTYTWSKVSGPGTVTFNNPNSLTTTATFSGSTPPVTGDSYVLKLTVTDGKLSNSSNVTITVRPSGSTENVAPVASFTATPEEGPAPLSVTFNAAGSSDSDGTIASYAWNFGDGSVGTGSTASHTYTTDDNYIARLTVTDNWGATHSVTKEIAATYVGVDTIAPVISNTTNTSFPAGTTQVLLTFNTHENGACRFSTTATTPFSSMTDTFSGAGTRSHQATIDDLTNGGRYTRYVRCQDYAATPNVNGTSTPITFSVRTTTTVPGTFTTIDGNGGTLLNFPTKSLYSGVVNFRPGHQETVTLNPPRFSWAYKPTMNPAAHICYNFICSAAAPYKFVFQVSDDPNFTNLIVNQTTLVNFYNFLKPFDTGTYYWRVGYILPRNLRSSDVSESVLERNASDQYRNTGAYAETTAKQWTLKDDSWAPSPYVWSNTRTFFVPNGTPEWDRSFLASTTVMEQKLGQHPVVLFKDADVDGLYNYMTRDGSRDGSVLASWAAMKTSAETAIASSWWTSATVDWQHSGEIAKAMMVSRIAASTLATDAEKDLARRIIAANPGRVVAKLAEYYEGTSICVDVVGHYELVPLLNALSYTYDWYHDNETAMSDADQATILRVLEGSLNAALYSGGYVYNSYDGLATKCDPTGRYNWGKLPASSGIFLGGDSHGMQGLVSRVPTSLACYSDSDICKFYFDVMANYVIGVTYPFSPEGAPNAGTGYTLGQLTPLNEGGGLLRYYMMLERALPEAHFDYNPMWKQYAKYYNMMMPSGLLRLGEQWTDYGGGDETTATNQAVGWIMRYTQDPVLALQYQNAKTRVDPNASELAMDLDVHGDGRIYDYLPLMWAYPRPTGRATTPVQHQMFVDEGYALGCTAPQNTLDCTQNGLGYAFIAKPRGIGVGGHAAYSDTAFDLWAYGTMITTGNGTSESTLTDVAWPYHPMFRNMVLVDGLGEMTARTPTHPYYNRMYACRGANGCASSDGTYVYYAADGTNAYPVAFNYETAFGTHLSANFNSQSAPYYAGTPLADLQKARRHFLFVKNKYWVIYDELQSSTDRRWSWKYHFLGPTFDLSTMFNPDPSNFDVNKDEGEFFYKTNITKFVLGFWNYSLNHPINPQFWRGARNYQWNAARKVPPPDVKVFVKQIMDPQNIDIVVATGTDRHYNPFTGEDYAGVTRQAIAHRSQYLSDQGVAVFNWMTSNGYLSDFKQRKGGYTGYPTQKFRDEANGRPVPYYKFVANDPNGQNILQSLVDQGKLLSLKNGNVVINYPIHNAYNSNGQLVQQVYVYLPQSRPPELADSKWDAIWDDLTQPHFGTGLTKFLIDNYNLPGCSDVDTNEICIASALVSPLTSVINVASNPLDQDFRANSIWVNSKEKTTDFHFMTVIYPKNPADDTAGNPDPEIIRLDDYTAKVINPDGTEDIISFRRESATTTSSNGGVNILVDVDDISPIPAPLGAYGPAVTATTYTLSVSREGSGKVESSPAGINCGLTCSVTVTSPVPYTLTATPAEGESFIGWSGACDEDPCEIVVSSDKSVTAHFSVAADTTRPVLSNISTSSTLSTSATITWTLSENATTRIFYGVTADSMNSYTASTSATDRSFTLTGLQPSMAYHYYLVSSDSSGNTAVSNTYTFETRTPTANAHLIEVLRAGNGTGVVNGTGGVSITCGSGCSDTVTEGQSITLTATPSAGSRFAGFVGGPCGTASPCTFTPSDDIAITATFTLIQNPDPTPPTLPVPPKATPTPTVAARRRSGGGSSNTSVRPAATPAPVAAPSQVCVTVPGISSGTAFTRTLQVGSTGNDVKALQVFLNGKGFRVAATGIGSPGKESLVFGPATKAALVKFQTANRITPASGILGPATRTRINSMGGAPGATGSQVVCSTPVRSTPPTSTSSAPTSVITGISSFTFVRTLQVGSTGNDVRALQVFLNSKGFRIATTGIGSPGKESTYFGPATQAALIRYQKANNIVPASGVLGPVTRLKINSLK